MQCAGAPDRRDRQHLGGDVVSGELLDRLRPAGLTLEITGGKLCVSPVTQLTTDQRTFLQEHGQLIQSELLREAAGSELELAPMNRTTGLPELSVWKTASRSQAARLQELAEAPELSDAAPEVVVRALQNGLTEAGAYELIGRIGDRIARNRRIPLWAHSPGGGGRCRDCGRKIGPTSNQCGSCKRAPPTEPRQSSPLNQEGR